MSSSRLDFDGDSYKYHLRESVGPGDYMVSTPIHECGECLTENPYIRPSLKPSSFNRQAELVDVGSELSGRTRTASLCPTKQYLPIAKYNNVGVHPTKETSECSAFLHTEDTKLSNPPCTLKGHGINRWMWLPEDPQNFALTPFENHRLGVSNRVVVKDNHVPCMPVPMDANNTVPSGSTRPPTEPSFNYGNMDNEGVRWKTCKEINLL
jgi:hypothetical protein